jgi:hypothetical protein
VIYVGDGKFLFLYLDVFFSLYLLKLFDTGPNGHRVQGNIGDDGGGGGGGVCTYHDSSVL